jgi:hypothetical protein
MDLEQHASQLSKEDICESFISVRPTQALKKLWESATLPNTLKEKQIAQLVETEFKYFYGHRLPWAIHIQPPIATQPSISSRPTTAASIPGGNPKHFGDHGQGIPQGHPKGASAAYAAGMAKDNHYHPPTGQQLKVVAKKS